MEEWLSCFFIYDTQCSSLLMFHLCQHQKGFRRALLFIFLTLMAFFNHIILENFSSLMIVPGSCASTCLVKIAIYYCV